MSAKKMLIKLHSVDSGFCRVYYTLDTTLYCFQEAVAPREFDLLQCTKDGEPSYIVRAAPGLNYSLDMAPADDSSTSVLFRAWLRRFDGACEAPIPDT